MSGCRTTHLLTVGWTYIDVHTSRGGGLSTDFGGGGGGCLKLPKNNFKQDPPSFSKKHFAPQVVSCENDQNGQFSAKTAIFPVKRIGIIKNSFYKLILGANFNFIIRKFIIYLEMMIFRFAIAIFRICRKSKGESLKPNRVQFG